MTFPELCRELGVDFRSPGEHHHVSENFFGLDCSGCSPNSKKFKLGYNAVGRYATCWTCGYRNLAWELHQASQRPYYEVVLLSKGLQGCKTVGVLKKAGKYDPPHCLHLTQDYVRPHREYLRGRGLDPIYIIEKWKVRATDGSCNPTWRLLIPIISNGLEVSWTTRAIHDDNQPRYVSARPEQELCPHKTLLYGHDYVRGACVVVEGPIDAWAIGPGAVATFGTNVTREQVLELSKIPTRAIVFDEEPAAQRAADKLCSLLESFPGMTYKVRLETGSDPGDASKKEIQEIRKRFLGD